MKAIGVKYVRAKHKDLNNGQDMVIQTGWMQLVGMVRTFSTVDNGNKIQGIFRGQVGEYDNQSVDM